jgi:uncharacterized protein (DUF2062 family)
VIACLPYLLEGRRRQGIWLLKFKRCMMVDHRQPSSFRALMGRLLHIEDTPERTALAFSIGIFLGFSPFLGFHTLTGLVIAFLFRLNRVAVLLGIWSNTPWWMVPYYTFATWFGMRVTRFRLNGSTLREIFCLGKDQGFLNSEFWIGLMSQRGLLLSFLIGSMILAFLLALMAYPSSLKGIQYYRSQKSKGQKAKNVE